MSADSRAVARRTLIVIGLVLATALGLAFVRATSVALTWVVVAAFFAVALNPLVDWVQRRIVRRRSAATLTVFFAAFLVLCALSALIVVPLLDDVARFADRAPDLLRETRAGRGPLGDLLDRFRLRGYAEAHADDIQRFIGGLGEPTLGLLRGAAAGLFGALTVVVLAFLMVVQAPRITARTLALVGEARAQRLTRIARECTRIITGYLSGNLLISAIIGLLTFVVLLLTGVPFAAVIALLVAIADLIPMVGATLGGIIAVGAGFLHSPTAGVIVLVFYVVYQQAENHLLQPTIMARTVRLNPLTVLISVLIAAQLGGLLGALLAIPAAGVGQVLVREFVPGFQRSEPATAATSDDSDQHADDHEGGER